MKQHRLLATLFLLFAASAHADHIDISFGPSMNGNTNPKLVTLGYEKVFDPGSALVSCGAMFEDSTNFECSGILSARVQTTGGMFSRIGFGPSFITHTDDRLSSIFEFNIQYALGFEQGNWDIGVIGNHFSNAGIWPPNYGRDFLGLLIEVGI